MRFAIVDGAGTVISTMQGSIAAPPAPPAGGRAVPSMSAQLGWVWNGQALVAPTPTLAGAQAVQIALLRLACSAQILGGCSSSALGSAHTYPTTETDQANMTASVTASLLPNLPGDWTTPFWCADQGGDWALQPHSVAQIQQAGTDIKTFIVTAQTKLRTLAAEVAAAESIPAVQAIIW